MPTLKELGGKNGFKMVGEIQVKIESLRAVINVGEDDSQCGKQSRATMCIPVILWFSFCCCDKRLTKSNLGGGKVLFALYFQVIVHNQEKSG